MPSSPARLWAAAAARRARSASKPSRDPSPTSSQFIDGAAPYPGYSAGDPLAGATAYLYWNNTVYFLAHQDYLKAYSLSVDASGKSALSTTPVAQTNSKIANFGFPVVSANGNSNGIVWAVEPAKAVLHAYDAKNLSNELYNSNQNSARDSLGSNVKFAPVTVVNGKVYVGTKNHLVGYGLLP